ncbi:MAG: hypothetical protein GOU97_04520 [Nanoarchaeota archaeon]|nr:hypothetical protein [Nanoarchaeota archaeon]
MRRAQVGMEYLVLISFFLLVVTPLFYFASDRSQKTTNLREIQMTVDKLENAINTVYADGHPAQREILVLIPKLINSSGTYLNGSTVNYAINFGDRTTDVFADTATCLEGTVPVDPGYYRIIIKALENGCVDIDVANIAVIPQSLNALVDYSKNFTQNFQLTNLQEATITGITVNATGTLINRVDVDSDESGRQDNTNIGDLGVGESKNLVITFYGDDYPAVYEGNLSLKGFGMANTTIPVKLTVSVGELTISSLENVNVAINTNKTMSLTVSNVGAGSLFNTNLSLSNELIGYVDLNASTIEKEDFIDLGIMVSGRSQDLTLRLFGLSYGTFNGLILGDSQPDVAGTNSYNHSLSITVGDDTVLPVINSTSVDKTSAIIGGLLCVNATATDDTQIDSVWVSVTNPDMQAINVTLTDTGSACAGINGDNWFGAEVLLNVNGTWMVNTSYAKDTSENVGFENANLLVSVEGTDSIPPIITIDYPKNASYPSNSFWINATLNEKGSWCGYNVDFASPTNVTMDQENDTNFYSSVTGLSDATHSITVYCKDVYNNTNHTGSTVHFTVDTQNPVLENCTLTNEYLREGEFSQISCDVIDANKDQAWFQIGGQTLPSTGQYGNTYSTSFYCSETGINEWSTAHANDSAGNEGSVSVGVNITCDTVLPIVNSTATNQSNAEVGQTICLNASVSDNYNVSMVWAELITPLDTTYNQILSDTGNSCSGAEGDGVYGGELYLLAIGNWTLVTSHANDQAGNTGTDEFHENETITVISGTGGGGGYTYVDVSRAYYFKTNGHGKSTADPDMKSWENITLDFTDDNPNTPASAYQLLMDIKLFDYDKYEGYVVKLDADPSLYSKVILKFKVDSFDYEPYPIRIHAYNSDGETILTNTGFTEYTYSSTGWHEVDVTDTAHRMNGFGWMRFRIIPKFAWWIDNKKSRWVEVDFGIE